MHQHWLFLRSYQQSTTTSLPAISPASPAMTSTSPGSSSAPGQSCKELGFTIFATHTPATALARALVCQLSANYLGTRSQQRPLDTPIWTMIPCGRPQITSALRSQKRWATQSKALQNPNLLGPKATYEGSF